MDCIVSLRFVARISPSLSSTSFSEDDIFFAAVPGSRFVVDLDHLLFLLVAASLFRSGTTISSHISKNFEKEKILRSR